MNIHNMRLPELRNFLRDLLARHPLHGNIRDLAHLTLERELLDLTYRLTNGNVNHSSRILGYRLDSKQNRKKFGPQQTDIDYQPYLEKNHPPPPYSKTYNYDPKPTQDKALLKKFSQEAANKLNRNILLPEPPSPTPPEPRAYRPPTENK